MNPRERQLLAILAAWGALYNKGRYDSEELTLKQLYEYSGIPENTDILVELASLVQRGFVSRRNTGYNGYGDHWVEGVDVWSVKPKGLMFLWGALTA